MAKPKIGIVPGDPGGIGPELVAKLLNDDGVAEVADILLIGDRAVFEAGQSVAGQIFAMTPLDATKDDWTGVDQFALHEMHTIDPADIRVAEVTEAGETSALKSLDAALEFTQAGIVDGLIYAPFNKSALHLAGFGHDDELHYLAEKLGVSGYISELNTLDGMWTSRVTSQIPLRDVADIISEDHVHQAVYLIDRVLCRSGISRPRISVAALNPHAGNNGNFGSEEIDILKPTVQKLADRQMAVDGPWPSGTDFVKAVAKEIEAVVTMYHDRGQIALKLLSFDRGVTVQGGLPIPVTTAAHGTAFDILCDMVVNWEQGEVAA
ncbi:MAG: 4-hydroxythreonine-4-phosphate dehydrogenase PdxA [Paracoccaceae bacterium]|nr:4-hydroxythreonine-4-phosphate dehydrogenase PdxA [Paracoccaceae bacterium]